MQQRLLAVRLCFVFHQVFVRTIVGGVHLRVASAHACISSQNLVQEGGWETGAGGLDRREDNVGFILETTIASGTNTMTIYG